MRIGTQPAIRPIRDGRTSATKEDGLRCLSKIGNLAEIAEPLNSSVQWRREPLRLASGPTTKDKFIAGGVIAIIPFPFVIALDGDLDGVEDIIELFVGHRGVQG